MTWATIMGRIVALCVVGAALAYIVNALAERMN